jgi:uncharacterized protein (DUF983 family)
MEIYERIIRNGKSVETTEKIDPIILVKILMAGGDPNKTECGNCALFDNSEEDSPVCIACGRESTRVFDKVLKELK